MRVELLKKPLPRSFARNQHARGLLAECDLRVTRRGRLRAKVLVFRTKGDLHRFWRKGLGQSLGRGTLGAVNQLAAEVWSFRGGRETTRLRCDPRYFCLVGLCRTALAVEIVAHEAVHAGYAYARRQRRDIFGDVFEDLDEERVAYPAGRILAGLSRFLHEAELWK